MIALQYGQMIENYKFPNDYRGVIHLHSELSPDSNGKFENIVKAAKNNQTDFVVITDHWLPELYEKSKRGFFGNTLFIAGAEISKNEGITILAIPLPKDFVPKENWKNNVISLHEKGSLALADHIEFSETSELLAFDGIEIINLHAHILQRSKIDLVLTYFQALWPWNWNLAYIFNDVPNLPRWRYLSQSVKISAFAGNDSHDNYRLFYKIGPNLGSYDNTFKLLTTHIWADELSESSVIEAVKNGQSYFAFEIFGNSKGFRFYATSDTEVFLPGSIITPKIGENKRVIQTTLTIQSPPHENPKNTALRILKNGKVIKEGKGILLNAQVFEPGIYYAEIWRNQKPWIFSNPIQIRPY